MITLSEAVLDELKRLRGRTERTFRIEPGCSCCHSPTLELIWMNRKTTMLIHGSSGFTFCIRKRMLDQLGNVRIEADQCGGIAVYSTERSLSSFVKNGRHLRFIALSITKGPETFPALSFYPPKRVLLVLAPVHP